MRSILRATEVKGSVHVAHIPVQPRSNRFFYCFIFTCTLSIFPGIDRLLAAEVTINLWSQKDFLKMKNVIVIKIGSN